MIRKQKLELSQLENLKSQQSELTDKDEQLKKEAEQLQQKFDKINSDLTEVVTELTKLQAERDSLIQENEKARSQQATCSNRLQVIHEKLQEAQSDVEVFSHVSSSKDYSNQKNKGGLKTQWKP